MNFLSLFVAMHQVFMLDNLDLGIFNLKHDVLPRISVFDQGTLRRMITMATDIGKGPETYSTQRVSPFYSRHHIFFLSFYCVLA
jgi:hypothetical protein